MLEHKESMDDLHSPILLGSTTSLPIQISHVHAKRIDVCDLFFGLDSLNVVDSEVFRIKANAIYFFVRISPRTDGKDTKKVKTLHKTKKMITDGLLRSCLPRNDVPDASNKHDPPPRVGRVGHGQKPEQRRPKSRTKWVETQGGARSFSEAFAFGTKALPALRLPT